MFPKGINHTFLPIPQIVVIGQYQNQFEIVYTVGRVQSFQDITVSFIQNGVVIDTIQLPYQHTVTNVATATHRCGTYLQGAELVVRLEADGFVTNSLPSTAAFLRAESADVKFEIATASFTGLRVNPPSGYYEWDLSVAPGCSNQYYNSYIILLFDSRPSAGSWGNNQVFRQLGLPSDPNDFFYGYNDGPLNAFPDEIRCDVTLYAAGYVFSYTFTYGVAP